MKKLFRPTALMLSLIIAVCCVPMRASGAVSGIQSKLDDLLKVYYDGTYFTSDGQPCYSSQSENCKLDNIPSRGGLPDGKTVTLCDGQGWSYSCRAFANYVWYYLFGIHYTNSKNPKTEAPVFGDFIKFNYGAHSAIYLWEDDYYWYVYDGNGDSMNGVHWNHAFSKARWRLTEWHHAYNYDKVADSLSIVTISPVAGRYTITNSRTGKYLAGSVVASIFSLTEDSSSSLTKLVIEKRSTGFVLSCADNPGMYLGMDDIGSIVATRTLDDNSLWDMAPCAGGVYIHNRAIKEAVLGEFDGQLCALTYTGASEQMWKLTHLVHDYKETVITQPGCTTEGTSEFACPCGVKYTAPIKATGHRNELIQTVAASDAVCGFKKYRCTACGIITRSDFTNRKSTTAVVTTSEVKVKGDKVYVVPGMSEESFLDLFPEFTVSGSSLFAKGTVITSSRYSNRYTVIVAGDTDGNGKADITDVRNVLRAAIGLDTADSYSLLSADWDGDGKLSVNDARVGLRLSIGLEKATALLNNLAR